MDLPLQSPRVGPASLVPWTRRNCGSESCIAGSTVCESVPRIPVEPQGEDRAREAAFTRDASRVASLSHVTHQVEMAKHEVRPNGRITRVCCHVDGGRCTGRVALANDVMINNVCFKRPSVSMGTNSFFGK